jgi:NAD(P)-dependent dehydrogenase (short-subunit alcohol dehydrogenase family)
MTELSEAVSVVTGAASGIGKATALALAREGSDVICADIDAPGVDATTQEIHALGRRSVAMHIDVALRGDVQKLVEHAIAWQGRCDIFISNVGVGCVGAPHEYTMDEWEYLLDVNLFSAIWPLRELIPHMLERGSGRLVFVSSGAGIEGQPDRAPYNVAKFGIVGLTESLARYLKGTGVGVSLVLPGAVSTNSWKRTVIAGSDDAESKRNELRDVAANWPRPEVMADAIVDGVKCDRYCILQHNPSQPDWYEDIHTRKGRDPDAFVLG